MADSHQWTIGDRFYVPGEWYGKTGEILMEIKAVFDSTGSLDPGKEFARSTAKPSNQPHGPAKRKKW